MGLKGFHTIISSRPMPNLRPVLRPRCWSGRNSTRRRRSKAHSKVAAALDEVHTIPPLRPHSALMAAVEFMYVIGVMPPSSASASSRSSQQSRTSSM